ncbi:MAG: cysteine desulfurase [Melioribacteraceae bacterium]|nr:cysteine desulfurase [Melioribacteraceae bacterium]
MEKRKIYFDNAATTPVHPKVREKMIRYLTESFGNPSSIHAFGRTVKVDIEEAREVIADFINADPGEIYFTSGGSEANNFALFGISKTEYKESGRTGLVSTSVEHHAVIDSLKELSMSGFVTNLIGVDNQSKIKIDELVNSLNDSVSLVAVIHTNNETGAINDVEKISEIVSGKNSFFHIDAVQGFAKTDIDVKKLNISSMAASGHKIYGPKGVGFLYAKNGTPLSPLIYGGPQERNRRGGTENVAGIMGLAEAVKLAASDMKSNYEVVRALNTYFRESVQNAFNEEVSINTPSDGSPYILSITFREEFFNNDAEAMLMYLDLNGIAASNGAACTSGTLKPSHVILGMGRSAGDASGTLRFSFNPANTKEEIDYTLEAIKKMMSNFRK